MKLQCLECGAGMQGRSDRKFCSDDCRASHHHKTNKDTTNFIRRINYRLRRNRNILSKKNPHGKARLHRMKLLDAGFRFEYFTNTYVTKSGRTYYFCYDQGYLPMEDGYYTLVRRQPYMEE